MYRMRGWQRTALGACSVALLTAGIGDMTIVKGSVGNQALKVPVTLSQKPGLLTTIGYGVTPGSAIRSSSAGLAGDYGGKVGGALSFGAAATSKPIALPIWPDPNPSSLTKSLTISLGSVTGAAITVLRPTATITILPVPSSGNLPGRATGGSVTFGGSCTAPGPVAGTEATVTWNAPTLGDTLTGYQVTYQVTLPDEEPVVETEFIASPQTTTGTRCYPVNAAPPSSSWMVPVPMPRPIA